MTTRVHITFTDSAGFTVKEALALMKVDEPVLIHPDDLSYGPIDPPSPELRADFECTLFSFAPSPEDIVEDIKRVNVFWDEALSGNAEPVVWFGHNAVRELTGCMEFVSRRSIPPLAIDVSNTVFAFRRKPGVGSGVAMMPPEMLVEYQLLEQVTAMSTPTFDAYRSQWAVLRSENAPLRVFNQAGALVSAPVTFFDDLIVSLAGKEWRPAAHVIADVIVKQFDDSPYVQTGDGFLISRLYRLIDDGRLEGRGAMTRLADTSVRQGQ